MSVLENKLIHPMRESFHDYLKDESKMMGAAESISFPESEAEIEKVLQLMRESRTPVTIQGGKTGVVGGAVPLRGHIMNLSHMKQVKSFSLGQDGSALLTVEPGVTLEDLRKVIQRLEAPEGFFWPPDPSELTATLLTQRLCPVSLRSSTASGSACSGGFFGCGLFFGGFFFGAGLAVASAPSVSGRQTVRSSANAASASSRKSTYL